MWTRVLALSLPFAWFGTGVSPSYACSVEKRATVQFRGATVSDQLSVSITGDPCHKATLDIKIASGTGALLYRYIAPFKQHVPHEWDDPALPQAASLLTQELVSAESIVNAAQLPEFADLRRALLERPLVSEERYAMLRQLKQPAFRHPTGYETWVYVVFDPKTGKAVRVVEGGT